MLRWLRSFCRKEKKECRNKTLLIWSQGKQVEAQVIGAIGVHLRVRHGNVEEIISNLRAVDVDAYKAIWAKTNTVPLQWEDGTVFRM